METHPFFALLLMYLKFVAVEDLKTISTNGRCIYFSPNFLDKLYDYELDYILCHQIMHIICGHLWRPYDREGDDYHFACDILINALLTNCRFTEKRYAHLGNVYRKIPGEDTDPAEMTPEEIYGYFPYSLYILDERTRSKFLMDSDQWWSEQQDAGAQGEIILDLPDLMGMLREREEASLRQQWQGRATMAAKSMETLSNDSGDVPDFIKRMVEKMGEPTVDWKKALDHFIQQQTCDYSFAPPDRRFSDTGFFLPDFNEKDFRTKEILFMVDTSGSVVEEDLARVYSEIRGAIEQFGGKLLGKLGFFDAAVTPPLPFESVGDLMSIIPYGGGGTNFSVIFDYVRKNYKQELPACIVIFTDGESLFPSKAAAMGIPVLWIINNNQITPPWGKTIRIPPKNH